LGNNPDVDDHVSAFQTVGGRMLTDERLFHGLTGLLALHARYGPPPASMDDLIDHADECDPDDSWVFREIEALADDADAVLRYASALANSSLDATAPLDAAVEGRRTPSAPRAGRPTAPLASFVLDLAFALADEAGFDAPVLTLLTPSDLRLLLALPIWLDERGPIQVAVCAGDEPETRLARRWLIAHHVPLTELPPCDLADFPTLPDQAVVLAGFDDRARQADLGCLEELTLQLSDRMRGIVVGPAAALVGPLRAPGFRGRPPSTGAPLSIEGDARRSALRSGRVRSIVRLQSGLLTDVPAAQAALWTLGPAGSASDTYCVDARGDRGPAPASDLVDDLVGAMGVAGRSAHRFLRGTFESKAALELASGELVRPTRATAFVGPAGVLRALDDLAPTASRDVPAQQLLTVRHRESVESAGPVAATTVGAALAAGDLKDIAGARIDAHDLVTRPDIPVVASPMDLRRRDQLTGLSYATLATRYGHTTLTQAGDIVVDPRATTIARVDHLGGVLVGFPARVLRCFAPPWTNKDREAALAQGRVLRERVHLPELAAAEMVADAARVKDWRAWSLSRLPGLKVLSVEEREAAAEASAALFARQRELEDALDPFGDLMSTLATALGAGLCTVSVTKKESA